MMRRLDIEVAIGNDPTVEFVVKNHRHQPINLSGATVECYVKDQHTTPDSQATKYQGLVLRPSTAGRCRVDMAAADVGGDQRQVYHLDVIQAGRRTTYFFGNLRKRAV